MEIRIKSGGLFFHAGAAGLIVALFYAACFWGIPFDFTGDLLYIYDTARGVTIPSLLGGIANPLTPAWFFSDDIVWLRPGQFLLMKLMHAAGHLDLPAAHLLACLGIAVLCGILYVTLARISGSKGFAWLGVLLYGTFPTHVYSMISIIPMDFQFFELSLMLGAVIVFWKALREPASSLRPFLRRLVCVAVLTWLAIKLKSAAKVLPFIFLALGGVHLSLRGGAGRRNSLAALAIVLAMFVMVVPFFHHPPASAKEQKSLRPNITYAMQRIFQSRPGWGSSLLTLKRVPPGSLTETYGFFLGWIFWGGLAVSLVRRWRKNSSVPRAQDDQDLFWPLLVWFGFALAGFAIGEPPLDANNRYLNYGLLPSVLLLFTCLFTISAKQPEPVPWKKKALRAGLAACLLLTIFQNVILFEGWVRQAVGFQWVSTQAQKEIFTDVFRRSPKNHEELCRAHPSLRAHHVWVEWEGKGSDPGHEILDSLRKNGTLYYLSNAPTPAMADFLKRNGVAITPVGAIALYDTPTLAMRMAKWLRVQAGKKGKGGGIFLFKLRLTSPSGGIADNTKTGPR